MNNTKAHTRHLHLILSLFYTTFLPPAVRLATQWTHCKRNNTTKEKHTIKIVNNSKERLILLKRYTKNVDVRFVPFTILADADGRLLSYSKGYIPLEMLFKQIDEGLEKRRRLPELKIS